MRRRRDRQELQAPISEAEAAISRSLALSQTHGLVSALASLRVLRTQAFTRTRPPASEVAAAH
jgi:hypothetical protein